jgi:hypothetical protein
VKIRKTVIWDGNSQSQLFAIDRETALNILHAIDDYLTDGSGDVKRLRPPREELRLRVGDDRIFFRGIGLRAIRIVAVKHRPEAYR